MFCHNDSMHPRQVPQYIGRKLGEFYGLLLARRSIVLSLEEDLNTTLRRSKNWRREKHFFVVWYLTPFQILCLWFKEDSCMMLQPVSCHNHQTNLELSRGWLFWVCIFFSFSFLAEWKIFIKERIEKQHQHLPKLHPKDSAELGPMKPKMLFSKRPVGQ